MKENPKIIIVGGGVAGLSAAASLCSRNFTNVVLLEARDRIGGRVLSKDHGGAYVEMGAQWIHGEEDNDIYKLAKEHNLTSDECHYFSNSNTWHQLETAEEKEVAINTAAFLTEAVDEISDEDSSKFGSPPQGHSAGLALRQRFKEFVLEVAGDERVRQVQLAVFDWFLRLENELCSCTSLDEVSLQYWPEYRECPGNNLVELKYGYSKVLEVLTSRFPSEWIKLNKVVTCIEWNHPKASNKRVSIRCSDGETLEADHVIVTIPLGCLKANAESIFHPPLPSEKLEAIRHIGFGTVNKIYLEYEEPFWEERDLLFPLWLDGKNYLGNEVTFSTMMNESSWKTINSLDDTWFRYIGRFAFVRHLRNVLCVWIAGKGAEHVETLSDQDVIEKCTSVLQTILRKKDIPHPQKIWRSRWKQDPYSQGSYSYISVDCDISGSLPKVLADPLQVTSDKGQQWPVVLFAGEATHSYYFSTVHGAYATGIREAERLDALHKQSIPRIVIVGGGAAGLAAAHRLVERGLTNVLLLEAKGRLGGRIHTQPYGDGVLEFGAQWIHGQEDNPLYDFALRNHLLANPVNHQGSVEGDGLFCMSDGKTLDREFVKEVMMVLETIKEALCDDNHYPGWKDEDPEVSVEKVFRKEFEKHLAEKSYSENQSTFCWGIYDWFIRFETIDNGCPSLDDASVKSYSEYKECPGIPLINLKEGYQTVVDKILEGIPNNAVYRNKSVKCIHWKQYPQMKVESSILHFPPRIAVECCDGEVILAHHVIVTPSLGFLKANADTFFAPSLPEPVSLAIKHLGFGTINKIYLEFPSPFWNKHELGFQLIWTNMEKDGHGTPNSYPPWVRWISGFDVVRGQPNVLVGWIGGRGAEEMESYSLEDVAVTCRRVLQQFLPGYNVPLPVKISRSSWFSDPYVRGAYSYFSTQFEKTGLDVPAAFKPVIDRFIGRSGNSLEWPLLLFAGEATDQHFYSTVHGALRSGWREANNIATFWSNESSPIQKTISSKD